ncbi:MAG: DmsE family decaheme c-type cytochrome [Acidobacteriia bacterium]|nr:DmsE family decaheme c-type cytochrome [Terriglobia bacterium]
MDLQTNNRFVLADKFRGRDLHPYQDNGWPGGNRNFTKPSQLLFMDLFSYSLRPLMKHILALCLCLPFLAVAQTPAAQKAPGAQNTFVGGTPCRTCHPDVWLNFNKNPHFKSIASGKEAPENTGCEGCHGAGGNHVAAKGGKATIQAFSQFSPDQVLTACLRCHSKDVSRAGIRESAHTGADVVCTNCHSVHKPATPKFLLAKQQTQLCYQCHTTVRSQFSMPSKHRVNEGAVQCTDCHNPHGNVAPTWRTGTGSRLVSTSHDNEQPCLKCHVDKRGPFIYEHASVRVEGCDTCHSPHGSPNSKLLRRPVVFTLCLECHNGAGTFGRQTTGVPTQSASHNLLDPRYQRCTTCHVRIHGSNSDARFLR